VANEAPVLGTMTNETAAYPTDEAPANGTEKVGAWGAIVPALTDAELTENGTVLSSGEAVFPFHLGFTPDRKHLVIRRTEGELGFEIPSRVTDSFIENAIRQAGLDVNGAPGGLAEGVRQTLAADRSFRKASEVTPRKVSYLWRPYIPRRCVTIIAGDGGLAKSMVTVRITAHVTRGETFPGGWRPMSGEPANVLMMSAEDDVDDIIVPRLMAGEADRERVVVRGFQLNHDLYLDDFGFATIVRQARELGPKLIVIDPLVSFMGEKRDMHRANEVRPIMQRCAALAVELDASIVLVAHFNKDETKKAGNRLAGTADFRNGGRSLLLAGESLDDEPERGRALFHDKANYARRGTPLGYDLEEVVVPGVDEIGRVDWRDTDLSPVECFGGGKRQTRSEVSTVRDVIRAYLSDQPGRRADNRRVKRQIRAALPKVNDRTIDRGREDLQVVVHRVGLARGRSDWELPALMALDDATLTD
jgi:hypothetical protein